MKTNNPKNRQKWIFNLLMSDGLNYVQMLAKYTQKWAISKTTFDKDWKTANEQYLEHCRKVNEAVEGESIKEEIKEAKKALKSKIERVHFYQTEIQNMEMQLSGEKEFTFKVGNKIMNSHNGNKFMCPIEIQNSLREQIKSYQSEISKLMGDYAPLKTSEVDENGKSILRPFILNVHKTYKQNEAEIVSENEK